MKPYELPLPNDVRTALEKRLEKVAQRLQETADLIAKLQNERDALRRAGLPQHVHAVWGPNADKNKVQAKEAEIDAAKKQLKKYDKAANKIVLNAVFPSKPSDELYEFQQHVMNMLTGRGWPALYLTNLPKKPYGKIFALAFSNALSSLKDGMTLEGVSSAGSGGAFHGDSGYYPDEKALKGLYYQNIGREPFPTLFITADEMIHAYLCDKLKLPIETIPDQISPPQKRDEYNAERNTLIEYLLTDTSRNKRYESTSSGLRLAVQPPKKQLPPLLSKNPYYEETKADGAPAWIINGTTYSYNDYRLFNETNELLRERAKQESRAGLEENTMVIWNEALVLHDGYRDPQLNYDEDNPPQKPDFGGRNLVRLDIDQHHCGPEGPIGRATGAPVTRIKLKNYPADGEILQGMVKWSENPLGRIH